MDSHGRICFADQTSREKTQMTFANLVFIVFFSFFALLALAGLLKPERTVARTIRYWQWYLKFFGLEATITPTPKAVVISRIWSLVMFIVLCSFFIAAVFGKFQ
jgi:hypothetical protein